MARGESGVALAGGGFRAGGSAGAVAALPGKEIAHRR